jgi:hypothetical protein
MNFAVNRKDMNIGTWVQSGEWLFEEFMFDDNCFGQAKVEYDVNMAACARNGDPKETYIENARVTEIVILDDDLKVVKKWDKKNTLMNFEDCEQIATTAIGENIELEVALDAMGIKETYEAVIREARVLYPMVRAVGCAFNDQLDRVIEAEDVNRE